MLVDQKMLNTVQLSLRNYEKDGGHFDITGILQPEYLRTEVLAYATLNTQT